MSQNGSVAVIGGGAWGTALANAVAGRHPVTLWLRDPEAAARIERGRENARYLPGVPLHPGIRATADAGALAAAGTVLLVTPAQTARAVIGQLKSHLPPGAPIVLCAKGIERGTDAFMSAVAAEALPVGTPVAVLSGPSFAADVARNLPTAVTLAAAEAGLAADLAHRLSGPTLRLYHTDDVRGVEIGGAGKNVLAIACGIVAGSGLGESARAALIARAFAELMRFARLYGGRPETLMGLSGLGDLVLTASSPQSRNFAFGERLGAGATPEAAAGGKLAEGAFTAAALVALARAQGLEMPIAEAVADIVAGAARVDAVVARLMARPLKGEVE
ncbi:NAD(P)H-dependent glycerol-3-phosphate dehydrogenase [Methylobacterium gregans]|uniref:Glycerol-3-phosphate dehydrogenase [NAD(P)+] n=1 Tax=Methylobacterium gregans TaxID=374424 RepID=A0AA37HUP7_9HYPH|nr:NAD(P)H-dependent glycerol-3-phosphate dehydrogenase [Methylobacterium gregans]MDQ0524037.1 glycerol-3-phosphate dehydrogenase (NAD(P)+) [Methylobacterium gregans]GJD81067.1 Glycerol-3-phosphate dehydrogenase [NAD(P)+] [Methylobacterium gregans]GLS56677.1 glycerol-3-phosphate dehydrogenase [NAD(P)+] [Methylobacterium gregans]